MPADDVVQYALELSNHLKPLCPRAADAVDAMKGAVTGEDSIEPLKVEFARLFVGPFRLVAPPYGSVYLEDGRKVMGDSTLDVLTRYREAGLELAGDFKDAPDHIAAELEFMYFLIVEELKALNRSDTDGILCLMEKQQSFLRDHLGAWISEFTKQVQEHDRTGFFSHLAAATRLFVEYDLSNSLHIVETSCIPEMCGETAGDNMS